MAGNAEDNRARRPLRVGITGGIASGKTTVCDAFAALGVPVIDTDQIARDVVAPGTAGLAAVVHAFGDDIVQDDGTLDRHKLRKIVFASDADRRQLESLLHPRILAETDRRIDALGPVPWCLVAIPLLVESGARERVDRVLVVDCPPSLQIARLMARDGEDEAGARRILGAQASRQARLAVADDVISNDGDRERLVPQVAQLHALYQRLAA